jgi:predicted Zn-dependent peptidase
MIHETMIEGIPTLLAPGIGPTRGGLTFRVGQADETVARAGITHLVEHLALHRLGLTDYHFNGATGTTVTHFLSQGSPDDVGEYLNKVVAALADLPFDRLEMEKEILRTEAASRGHSPAEVMLLWRYGARGYGVPAYPEWGLSELTPDDLRAWVARYFTRDNAVLWFSGAVPGNLSLPLPAGTRQPLPEVSSALAGTPAFFAGPPRTVALHAPVRRSPAAQVFAGVMERELFRALRQEGGYSYTVGTAYEPLDKECATLFALADAHQDKQDAALGAFIDVVAKLRWGALARTDLEGTLAKAREALRDPDADANRLPGAAFNVLVGAPVLHADEQLARLEAVTLDDLRPVAEEMASAALLMVPEGRDAEWAGYVPAPTQSTTVVEGSRHRLRGDSNVNLIVGRDGVSVTSPDSTVTIRFAECAVMLAWPDGGRMLIGHDGVTARVEPTMFEVDAATLAGLDASVPPGITVRQPPRSPDEIPQPAAQPLRASSNERGLRGGLKSSPNPDGLRGGDVARPRKGRALTIVALVLFAPLAALALLVSVLSTPQLLSDPDPDSTTASTVAALIILWGFSGFFVLVTVLLIRRLRR